MKACDPYLRFVFLTGITKFSQLSIFSELNNILNISMLKPYAAICGITQEEMQEQMTAYIERLAVSQEMSKEETLQKLKEKYDGYHFTRPSPDIYNPFSLLNAFANDELNNYWFGSGTPTYLIEMLRKFHVLPSQLGGSMQAMAADFDAPTEKMEGIVPLLYQSGYFTIKDYNKLAELYTLDIPNGEIRIGLMRSLLPGYLAHNTLKGNTTIARMYLAIAGEIWTGPCVFFRNSFLLFRIVITRIMRDITSNCSTSSSPCSGCMSMWRCVPPRGVWMW